MKREERRAVQEKQNSRRARTVALCGVLFSLALVLGLFESAFCALLALPPGIRLGLANIVVLFAMLALGWHSALALILLKALFAFLTRGAIAAALSLAGGLCSFFIMLLLVKLPRVSCSVRMLSIAGAVAHNIGQLAVAYLLIRTQALLFYLPVLAISGIAAGLVTGSLYRMLRPYFGRLFFS